MSLKLKGRHFKFLILTTVLIVLSSGNLFAKSKKETKVKTEKGKNYVNLPVIKLNNPVKSIEWNRTDESFAYSERNNIVIRDAKDISIKQQITADREIRILKYAEFGSNTTTDQLLSFGEDNVMAVRVLPDPTPSISRPFLETTQITALEFSNDGTYIGLGTDSGQANLFMQLYMTGELSNRMLLNHKNRIYAIAFSPNGKYLGTASKDGTLRIWETKSAANISVMQFNTPFEFGFCFTAQGENVIVAKDLNHLSVRNFIGVENMEIFCEKEIRDIALAPDGQHVIVLNGNNDFEFYNLSTGEYIGYIPPWNTTNVTCYDFSHDGKRLLIGHYDGSIYILDIENVFIKAGEKPPLFKVEDADTKKKWFYDSEKKTYRRIKGDNVTWNTSHNLEFRGSGQFTVVKQFNFGGQLGLGYVNDWLIAPFTLGAFFNADMYFPSSDFGFKYSVGTVTLPDDKNPNVLGFSLGINAGKDFKLNQKWSLVAEIHGGGAMRAISSPVLGTGKWNTSLYLGGLFGAKYNNFLMYTTATYDSVMKMNIGLGISYRVRLVKKIPLEEYELLAIPKDAERTGPKISEADSENGEETVTIENALLDDSEKSETAGNVENSEKGDSVTKENDSEVSDAETDKVTSAEEEKSESEDSNIAKL